MGVKPAGMAAVVEGVAMSNTRARAHVAKAREFLTAAEISLEAGRANSAASSAVTAGINAKDAVCLHLVGVTGKTDRHEDAVKQLSRTGPTGKMLAPSFKRLLGLKTPSQYSA